MCGIEHTASFFFNDVTKILVVNQMIIAHKAIYNLFGSGIYHKHHSLFKSESYEFHNRNIGLFSGNFTIMAGYFIGMHKYLVMKKALLATVSSAECNTVSLNSKLYKVGSYIQDNKACESIYVLLKIFIPCLRVLSLAYSKKKECTRYSTVP